MPDTFTPPLDALASYYSFPVTILEDGDEVNESSIRPLLEEIIEASESLNFRVSEIDRTVAPIGRLKVLENKLGFSFAVADAAEIDWTDGASLTPVFATTPSTLLKALNDVDVGAGAQRDRLDIFVPRVMPAGDSGGFPPYDTSPTLFDPTDDHHLALSKLEVGLVATSASVSGVVASAASNATSIQNLEDKLDPGVGTGAADVPGPFNFTYNYIIGDNPLRAVVDRLDQEVFGLRQMVRGLTAAVGFSPKSFFASSVSSLGGPVTGLNVGLTTAVYVPAEHRVRGVPGGPSVAVFNMASPGTGIRLFWQPVLAGITVRGNSNDGTGVLSSIPWNQFISFDPTGLGGQLYLEFTFPNDTYWLNFFMSFGA
jgi:hypothetical protein